MYSMKLKNKSSNKKVVIKRTSLILSQMQPPTNKKKKYGEKKGRDEKVTNLGSGIIIITSLLSKAIQGSVAPRVIPIFILQHVILNMTSSGSYST